MDTAKLMALVKSKKAALKTKDKTIKPQPGSNRYILLPGWRKGEEHVFHHDFGQHYIKDAADQVLAVAPCQSSIYGKACEVCTHLSHATRATSDDSVVELLGNARGKTSYLVNVLALDSEDETNPQTLELGRLAFGQLVGLVEEWSEGIFDPESPQIIVVQRDGKGLKTKYTVQVSPKKHAMPKGVMSRLPNLDEFVDQGNEDVYRRARQAIDSIVGTNDGPSVAPESDRPVTHDLAPSRSARAPVMTDDLDDFLGGLEDSALAA